MSFGGINTFQQYSTDFGLGHNGVRVSFNFFDGIPEPSLLNSLASNDLKLIFKSVLKRDETTKEKALTDLLKLVEGATEEDYMFDNEIFFLCWSQIYPKLLVNESKGLRISSHLITAKLIKLLNKRITKFLKDLIPFLLIGACDTDVSVSRACATFLNDIFDNDSKKISSLWYVFQEDILNIARALILNENEETISDDRFVSKEDSQLRFNRLITSAVYLLTNLTKTKKFDFAKHMVLFNSILRAEPLWNLLNFKNLHFLKSYEATLQLMQTLYYSDYLPTQKNVLKLSSKKLLKSLSQVNSKNSLKVSHLTGPILHTLAILDSYKEGKIWTYDKSAKDRLLTFLAVACSNPAPGFFDAMYELSRVTSSHNLLDNELEWFPIWRRALKSLNGRAFLGRFGAELFGEFWNNYRKFVEECGLVNMYEVARTDAISTLESEKQLSKLPALREALRDFLKPDFIAKEIEKIFTADVQPENAILENLVSLLAIGKQNEPALHEVVATMFSILSNNQSGFTDREFNVLKVYDYFVRLDLQMLYKEISQFTYEVPTWIEKDTYESLARVMIDYSKSSFTEDKREYTVIMDDFFTAALSADIPSGEIANTLDQLSKDAYLTLSLSSAAVQEFIKNYISSYQFDTEGEIFKGHLINEKNIKQLYEAAIANESMGSFLHHLPLLQPAVLEELLEHSNILSRFLFIGSLEESRQMYELIKPFINHNLVITESLAKAIVEYATSRPLDAENMAHLEFAIELVTLNRENLSFLIPSDIEAAFANHVPFVDYRLALVSYFSLNTYLLEISTKELDMSRLERLISYGLFLDALMSNVSDCMNSNLSLFLTMIAELAEDYNCLSVVPREEFHDFKNTMFKQEKSTITLETMIEVVTGASSLQDRVDSELLGLVSESSSSTVTFYKLRIFSRILLNEVECVSKASFSRIFPQIEGFVMSTTRNRDKSQMPYLLASAMLLATKKFNGSDLFTKLRNLFTAECIGVKENELLNGTYKHLILLDNLLVTSDQESPFDFIAPQRLNMMLGSLQRWLDSDVVYEPPFIKVRLALLRLVTSLLMLPSIRETSTNLFDFSTKLLIDSLSMCQLEDTDYILELRLCCLRLYKELNKAVKIPKPGESYEEVLVCLNELCLIDFPTEQNNQISSIFYRELFKVMGTYSGKELVAYFPQFLENFLANEDNENINRSRLLVGQLERLIIEKQRDAFMEYEFRKQNMQSAAIEGQDDGKLDEFALEDNEFKFPAELIDKMNKKMPQDYLESENEYAFLEYLWFWDVALYFFNDASYNLKQLFIDQLKSENLIENFFDFVADQIDLQETGFWIDVGPDAILNYSVASTDFSPYKEDIFVECKKLLGHLLYKMFVSVGSLTSHWWLNIKDRSLQSKIESFVSQFISPMLIEKELDDVAAKMESLTSNDDALTIKINKVTNEVKAQYLIDEQKLELAFKLPANYPLTNVQVIGVSRVGISEQKWKQWIMSTQRVITGMNGTVMDSLELFTKNVNLQFSGFEECAICYSILHSVDRKLPSKTCPTCNNKFHGACLYKWFRSSGNNTCPLCRSEIPFRR